MSVVDPNIIAQLTNRALTSKDVFTTLPDELRMRAFTIARVTEANVLQNTLDALRATIEKGGTLWDFKQDFPEMAKDYFERGRDWHLNLIFNNNIRQARAVGAYQARQVTKAAFPYVEYLAGVNPRPSHEALDGKIFGVDDSFLHSHTPPWEHGCNCDLNPRTAAQVGKIQQAEQDLPEEERSVTIGNPKLQSMMSRNQLPDPDAPHRPISVLPPSLHGNGDNYSFRPDRLNQTLDLSRFDPEIRDRLMKDLAKVGYRLSSDGSSAIPGPPPIPGSSIGVTPLKSHLGRPTASKAQLSRPSGGVQAAPAVGRPTGRISRPAPQIARVARAQNRSFKEAA